MELNLTGKVALITGSSKGIGNGIAKILHAEGCRVILNGRNAEVLENSRREIDGAIAVQGDVTQPKEAQRIVEEVFSEYGLLDVLVCNVGSGASVLPGDETFDEWQRVFSLNLWSTTNMVEAAQASLIDSKGVIVCISSICGSETIHGAPVTYSAAKSALNAYVRGMARPLGKQGVRINAVAPGNILFDGSVWQRKLADDFDEVREILSRDVSLGELGELQDVAALVAFLASPRSKFSTGGVWNLDGGQARS